MNLQWNKDMDAEVLKIARKYRTDPVFRKEADQDSWAVVRELSKGNGEAIARKVIGKKRDLRVHFNDDKTIHVVLPAMAEEMKRLDSDDLSAISGGSGCASTIGTTTTASTMPSTFSSFGTLGSASSHGG